MDAPLEGQQFCPIEVAKACKKKQVKQCLGSWVHGLSWGRDNRGWSTALYQGIPVVTAAYTGRNHATRGTRRERGLQREKEIPGE